MNTTLWSRDREPLDAGVLTDPDWNENPAALRPAWVMSKMGKAKCPDASAVNQERFIASHSQQLVGGHSGIPALHFIGRLQASSMGMELRTCQSEGTGQMHRARSQAPSSSSGRISRLLSGCGTTSSGGGGNGARVGDKGIGDTGGDGLLGSSGCASPRISCTLCGSSCGERSGPRG